MTLTHSATGGEYADVSADLPVTVTDDDRGLVLSETSLEVDEGDTSGVTYTVKLATEPSEGVTVTVSGHSGTGLYPGRTQRGGHPDVHHHQLEHRSDHNGQGRDRTRTE